MRPDPRKIHGFTLVELIVVIVIAGVLATSMFVFMKPAIDSYVDVRRRAELTDMADTALRRMALDIRRAVPNSVIAHSGTCIQLVPTIAGGRYRMAPDTTVSGTSAWLDPTGMTSAFDVLTPMATLPTAGDWVVIGNQNGGDVYSGVNRAAISAVAAAGATYQHRITLAAATQFPVGYDGGRFVVVPDGERSVFYNCVIPPGGTGNLYRTVGTFGDGAAKCGNIGALVATDISSCTFGYSAGTTERSALVWLQLQLSRAGESISLAHGVHVDNVP